MSLDFGAMCEALHHISHHHRQQCEGLVDLSDHLAIFQNLSDCEEETSKWHVDWYGIPEGLSWTLLVPIWPADWSHLGGTQLCLQQPELQRASTVPKAAKASAQTVLKEVSA